MKGWVILSVSNDVNVTKIPYRKYADAKKDLDKINSMYNEKKFYLKKVDFHAQKIRNNVLKTNRTRYVIHEEKQDGKTKDASAS